ncbi:MAG: SDR family NAD(P)-dependent oxidoreductase [Alphaproteobacteria bacterium]
MGVLDHFKLDGKVAVVTGSGRGIGRGIALCLAEAGAAVVVSARRKEDIDAVAKEIEAAGGKALAVQADVTNTDDMERIGQAAVDAFGTLDIWVNNAGGVPDGTARYLTRMTSQTFNDQINLNFNAVYLGCMVAAKHMGASGGSIINVSSATSRGGHAKNAPYAAAKAAVNSFTASMAAEVGPTIRVNAVAPGPVVTDNFKDCLKIESDEQAEMIRQNINLPLQRYGTPEDIGAAVVFMASPASAWVTGETLFVAGGL